MALALTSPPASRSRSWQAAVAHLGAHGIDVWLGGGWAAELLGIEPPRIHRDVDLAMPAESFADLDAVLADLDEVKAKRFPHKRAFVLDGGLVEVMLLQPAAGGGWRTRFFDLFEMAWPEGSLIQRDGVRLLSSDALAAYDRAYPAIAGARRVWLGG